MKPKFRGESMSENKNAKTPTDDGKPVAWQLLGLAHFRRKIPAGSPARYWDPLYAAPPKREWVGLTADEIWKCNKAKSGSAVEFHICYAHQNVLDFAESIEAELREKNKW